MTKIYKGPVYIGVVGSETENGECRDSIDGLKVRLGDIGPQFIRATKGYEARQIHADKMLKETDCEFLFLMDSDMVFLSDALEQLRSHQLPFVSGFYMRRRYSPVAPVWFEPPKTEMEMPLKPWTEVVEANKLYEIGASGWGCALVHRDVLLAVEKLLKGEPLILEDDMDVWPYELNKIMAAIDIMDSLTSKVDVPAHALRDYVNVLKQEIRPLRGVKDPIGSDIRFPFYARVAGYKMYGDAGVDCKHMLNYPLSASDFVGMPEAVNKGLAQAMSVQDDQERRRLHEARATMEVAKVENA